MENQNNNWYNNISTINISRCKKELINKNIISENDTLLIYKIDYFSQNNIYPFVFYEIYNLEKKEKLDLNYCNKKIIINKSADIDENNIFLYDPDSDFYNDICFTYTTKFGTDIILSDRKKEFIENNFYLCENNCKFIGYDNDTKEVSCECDPQNIFSIFDININSDVLLKKFFNLSETFNFEVLFCHHIVFTKKGLIKNLGNYISLIIILIYVALTIIFFVKGKNKIQSDLRKIINKQQEKSATEYFEKKNSNSNKQNYNNKLFLFNSSKNLEIIHKKNSKNKNSKTKIKIYSKKIQKKEKVKKKENNNKKREFNDYELNELKYEKALIYDKRTYIQIYWSSLKKKQLILFSFYPNNDYNSQTIKVCLFFYQYLYFLQ